MNDYGNTINHQQISKKRNSHTNPARPKPTASSS